MEILPTVARELPDELPARMLNQFTYCPRLFYLEWVESEWADNADTLAGERVHRRVDREVGEMPLPEEWQGERLRARSLTLSAPLEGLVAKLDLLEGEDGLVAPVDYKKGHAPDGPIGAWEPDKVQLAVQALVLRENGYRCERGIVYYAGSKRRVEVLIDEALVERTRALLREARAVAASGERPPPLVDSPKCPRCSLVGICLPDETRLLTSSEPVDADEVRRLLPARDDALPVYVQSHGARVGKSGEELLVQDPEGRKERVRLIDVSQLCLFGSATITSQALAELLGRGISVCHFSYGGWFYGLSQGLGSRNGELRLHQYRAVLDPAESLRHARSFVESKILNSRTMLRRNHTAAPEPVLNELARLAERAREAESIESLLGLEGLAAKAYFAEFSGMLSEPVRALTAFHFETRNRRPPRDPVNALLSLAYSVLAKDFTVALLAVGLDPYIGLFHRLRCGRASLALDLMEEFRPLIGDSVVLQLLNNAEVQPQHFVQRGPAVNLTDEGRKKFFFAYERRMTQLVRHPLFGYRISYRQLLEIQSRLFARTLSGELAAYPGFRTR